MFDRFKGIALAILAPVLLVGCAFSPGKFASTLTILADRSFTFSYQGEVIAVDIAGEMAKGMGDAFKGLGDEDGDEKKKKTTTSLWRDAAWQEDDDAVEAEDDAEEAAKKEAKFKAIAEALTKEAGYRSVTYKGDGVFVVDYQISGKLTHGFLWPYNLDAEVIFPFVVLELRGADAVRVKAPAFGDNDSLGKGKSDNTNTKLDGTFTLITDGELVSQNNEDGAKTEGTRRTVTWKATPLSKDAPMAVVKFAPKP
ncbi:hypothetical protein K9B35_12625 [Sphingomonas sp. R647]|uniref:hypothetical protein n=1 Tax=Sphingomonas sp. R647 TaxID=2875233 RepID=UPI001CD32B74|nr:hypothetical protein [Sphingomonas sp. R647]MCA1198815.1 hypothetical protein [Sphingomonas sp. R647]